MVTLLLGRLRSIQKPQNGHRARQGDAATVHHVCVWATDKTVVRQLESGRQSTVSQCGLGEMDVPGHLARRPTQGLAVCARVSQLPGSISRRS